MQLTISTNCKVWLQFLNPCNSNPISNPSFFAPPLSSEGDEGDEIAAADDNYQQAANANSATQGTSKQAQSNCNAVSHFQ